uniref:Uncharacterized protein n=1 Tax=Hyaloperonospora arabidopsidis (strain Emoy2) TaxID=559515 RepID=M4BUT0_HYAAE
MQQADIRGKSTNPEAPTKSRGPRKAAQKRNMLSLISICLFVGTKYPQSTRAMMTLVVHLLPPLQRTLRPGYEPPLEVGQAQIVFIHSSVAAAEVQNETLMKKE